MEIIENKDYVVTRAESELPYLYWQQHEFPKDDEFFYKIQLLALEGSTEVRLPLNVLEEIAHKARFARDKAFENWNNPVTNCCGVPRPRSETKQGWFLERFEITCKDGYGCKAEKVEKVKP